MSSQQYPNAVPYGTVWPYLGAYGQWGFRRRSSGRWKDKAIFLQREINDLQAERGLYERQLAVTAANIGLIKQGNLPSGASASAAVRPAGALLPGSGAFAWFKGTRPMAAAPVPSVPFAGTAVPVMPAMPLALPAATGAAVHPQSYSVVSRAPSALMSVEEPLPTLQATEGLRSAAAPALPPARVMPELARQDAAMLAARGTIAAAQAQVSYAARIPTLHAFPGNWMHVELKIEWNDSVNRRWARR